LVYILPYLTLKSQQIFHTFRCVRYDSQNQHRLKFSNCNELFSATYDMNFLTCHICVHSFVRSFRYLLYNRSISSFKAISLQSVMLCFLFHFLACYLFLEVFSSCLHLLPHLPVASVPTLSFLQQRVLEGSFYGRCDQSSWPSCFLLYVGYSYSSSFCVILCHFSHDRSNWSCPSFTSTTFQDFQAFLIFRSVQMLALHPYM
jgi:hypothetical protein